MGRVELYNDSSRDLCVGCLKPIKGVKFLLSRFIFLGKAGSVDEGYRELSIAWNGIEPLPLELEARPSKYHGDFAADVPFKHGSKGAIFHIALITKKDDDDGDDSDDLSAFPHFIATPLTAGQLATFQKEAKNPGSPRGSAHGDSTTPTDDRTPASF